MRTNRRDFIKLSLGASAGLSIGFSLSACSNASDTSFSPNAWLSITEDNQTIIKLTKTEMGQDIITTVPKIVAEELELNWHDIHVELAKSSPRYGIMRTSGSRSVRELWKPLRVASASAKEMLLAAASEIWQIPTNDCRATNGVIKNTVTGESLNYGKLASLASKQTIPSNPTLKPKSDYNHVGHKTTRYNILDIVTGQEKYGIDQSPENLLHAAVIHAPEFDAKLDSFSSPDKNNGIYKIVSLENAVAVIAKSYAKALKCAHSLDIKWQQSSLTGLSQEKVESDFQAEILKPGSLVEQVGEVKKFKPLISRQYSSSYQAHTCMEPMNCTVHITEDACNVWVPTQHPAKALEVASNAYHSSIGKFVSKALKKIGVDDKVNVYPTLMGGGFGRRLEQDYVEEAVLIAKEVGQAVKVIWTREEDVKHDYYRPYSIHELSAEFEGSQIHNLVHKAVGASQGKTTDGALNTPYNIPNRALYFSKLDHQVPIGSWRSVSYSNHIFASESFVDEVAEQNNIAPLAFRKVLLKNNERALRVLQTLENQLNNSDLNSTNGYAISTGFGSYIATAVCLKNDATNLTVKEILCVVDCGIAINPDSVEAQISGGVIYGLSAALQSSITIEAGQVKQSNFDDYPLPRISDIPKISVLLVDSDEAPGGVGEISVPTVAPALANAYANLTGKRIRHMPMNVTLN